MAGIVFVDGIRVDKAGTMISENAEIFIKENLCPYVSRGGLKLEKSLSSFNIDLEKNICMDMGASTGGFTDCMLKNGAEKVYSVDVGYGQLDWKLRNDPRVINMEKTNIRYMNTDENYHNIDFISIDVSFISLKLIFPVASKFLKDNGEIVCLVKPQFEAGREQIGKKGIVRDKSVHREVIENVIKYGEVEKLYPQNIEFSPVTGAKGNIEYLLHLKKSENDDWKDENIVDIVEKAHLNLS